MRSLHIWGDVDEVHEITDCRVSNCAVLLKARWSVHLYLYWILGMVLLGAGPAGPGLIPGDTAQSLAAVALVASAINIGGGFTITQRCWYIIAPIS